MLQSRKCAVIGAGIVGTLIAEQLHSVGMQVIVYDKEPQSTSGCCSKVAAAMLAPYCELDVSEPVIMEMGVEGLGLWDKLIQRYAPDVFYKTEGTIVVAHKTDTLELDRLYRRINSNNADVCSFLDHSELKSLEPHVADTFDKGMLVRREGQIDGISFLTSIQNSLMNKGVIFSFNTKISSDHQIGDVDWVIDCRGFSAKHELLGMRGVRGEILAVHAPEVRINRPIRIMHPRYPIYIVPRPDHRYLIGATTIESESEKQVTIRSALELLSTAFSAHPGFAEAEILKFSTGVRPAFRDNLPKIMIEGNRIVVNGLFRHGFLVGPVLASQVAKYIQNGDCLSFTHQLLVSEHSMS